MDLSADFLIEKETITGKEFMEIFHKVQNGEDVEAEVVAEEQPTDEAEVVAEEQPAVEAEVVAEEQPAVEAEVVAEEHQDWGSCRRSGCKGLQAFCTGLPDAHPRSSDPCSAQH